MGGPLTKKSMSSVKDDGLLLAHSVLKLTGIQELSQMKLEHDVLFGKSIQSLHNLFSPWPSFDRVYGYIFHGLL